MSINWFGAFTLLKKEVWRFLKVYHQTLFSPVVNIILFLAVFSLSVGNHIAEIEGVPFATFMAAGLIMMASMQNSFANSSSSFVMGKVMGHFIDYLIPPLGAFELLFAFTFGAILRGICVGIVAFLAILIFVPLSFYSFSYAFFYLFAACMFLGFPILFFSCHPWVDVLISGPIPNPLSICSVLVVSIGPTWDAHDAAPGLSGTPPRFEVMGYILQLREGVVGVSLFVLFGAWRTFLSWD